MNQQSETLFSKTLQGDEKSKWMKKYTTTFMQSDHDNHIWAPSW